MEKFRVVIGKYDKNSLKALLEHLAFHRILHELVLADMVNVCRGNGESIPKSETEKDCKSILEGERVVIDFIGRKEAAKVYGQMEGITSDMKTVDYILGEKEKKKQ